MSLVDLGKRLLETAKRGDTEEVRALMSNGAPFTTDWLGTSPLHFAAQMGHLSTAEILLRAGISRDARTKVDRTPLHVAAQEGHLEVVDLLLRNGADVEAKDMLKMSPLHWAVEKGNADVIAILIKSGADIHCANKFDKTPLDIAITNGRADLVQLMQFGLEGATADLGDLHGEPSKVEEVTTEVVPEAIEDEQIVMASPVAMVPNLTATVETDGEKLVMTPEAGTDQSSTSVLATLAALAEATAPYSAANTTNATATDTLNWLQTHGITMISGDNQTMVSSALASGQILTLTEAGKLALNSVKQQELDGEPVEETVQETIIEDEGMLETIVEDDTDQNVITIVTDAGVSEDPNVVTVAAEEGTDESSEEPMAKKARLDATEQVIVSTVSDLNNQDELRRELEAVRKEAEAVKAQLRQKAEEAESYKKQLNMAKAEGQIS